jgi:hypothetical protein
MPGSMRIEIFSCFEVVSSWMDETGIGGWERFIGNKSQRKWDEIPWK